MPKEHFSGTAIAATVAVVHFFVCYFYNYSVFCLAHDDHADFSDNSSLSEEKIEFNPQHDGAFKEGDSLRFG